VHVEDKIVKEFSLERGVEALLLQCLSSMWLSG